MQLKNKVHTKRLSKAYFTLGILKISKFSRKNTATGDNIVLQVENFF